MARHVCKECGREFTAPADWLQNNREYKGRYCSLSCAAKRGNKARASLNRYLKKWGSA